MWLPLALLSAACSSTEDPQQVADQALNSPQIESDHEAAAQKGRSADERRAAHKRLISYLNGDIKLTPEGQKGTNPFPKSGDLAALLNRFSILNGGEPNSRSTWGYQPGEAMAWSFVANIDADGSRKYFLLSGQVSLKSSKDDVYTYEVFVQGSPAPLASGSAEGPTAKIAWDESSICEPYGYESDEARCERL